MEDERLKKRPPEELYSDELRKEVRAKDQESELFGSQREEFCRLLEQECSFTREDAEYSHDIRRVLMHIQSKFDLTLDLQRDDFFALLSIGKDMLYDEGRAKFLPFIIRRQRLCRPEYPTARRRFTHFKILSIHPFVYFSEMLPCRFVDFDELLRPFERADEADEGLTDDLKKLLDFCATIHTLNTAYYHAYPKVGVPEEGVSQGEHIQQKRGEANHLVIWRGLPYQILHVLVEADVLKNLSAKERVQHVEEIARMCLHEYFNLSFFHPDILEKPVQAIAHATQLLHSLIAHYGEDPFMREALLRALERERPRFNDDQMMYLQAIYSGEEPTLSQEQLMRIEEITEEKEKPLGN